MEEKKPVQTKIIFFLKKFIILVLIFLALTIGYAAGRGFKTYEVNLLEKNKLPVVKKVSVVNLQTLQKKTIPVMSGWRDPKVEVVSTPDSLGGATLNLKLTSFFFSPNDFGNPPKPNTGNAYALVNNVLVGRAFNNYFSIAPSTLETGINIIKVVLAANDGSLWIARSTGKEISATIEILK